jgi:hypothetical protein
MLRIFPELVGVGDPDPNRCIKVLQSVIGWYRWIL